MDWPDLPIRDVLPQLLAVLDAGGVAVLQAPPGAGKTTLVPLALLQAGNVAGRIVMLEPRRLAARAAAERMAATLGEMPGRTVGYRIRGEARVSPATRIEVVTEGILTRMLQSDPELPGIGAVIFDEFHERSLNADLGLALTCEVRAVLREDLKLMVMSATLDAEPVAQMLGAPVVTSEGRAFPVETRWLDRPREQGQPIEPAVTALVRQALEETQGGILVFLPGAGEINRVAAALAAKTPPDVQVLPLYAALPFARQRAAIEPAGTGRKVVLATSIAETSLTIQDIRVVVDCGLSRRARYDPGTAMSQLVTERVTKAEADQRRGRAGRVGPGICYRMWAKREEGGLAGFPAPEIEAGDLTGLALELAQWGADPAELAFVTQPPPGRLEGARALLRELGALDPEGRITGHGRDMARLPLHPRLAHMLVRGGKGAAGLAALLAEGGRAAGSAVDLTVSRAALNAPGPVRREAGRLARLAVPDQGLDWPELAALAYPDRIALRRPGAEPRYVLSGGRGAVMDSADDLAGAAWLVVTDIDGKGRDARIRRALQISESQLRNVLGERIEWTQEAIWDGREGRVRAVRAERLGAIALTETAWKGAPHDVLTRAALDGFRDVGLGFSDAANRFRARVERLREAGEDLPDMSDAGLLATLDDWLLPHLDPVPRTASDIRSFDVLPALTAMLDWPARERLDLLAPATYRTPTGRKVAIDYSGAEPEVSVRLQEMFGVTQHPVVAGRPLKVTLLSPAGRPLQTTTDLPAFWTGSYGDVRRDMRGRYPKHPWPEDPAAASPTMRVKPRAR